MFWRIDKCLYGLYCTIQSFNCLGFKRFPLYLVEKNNIEAQFGFESLLAIS